MRKGLGVAILLMVVLIGCCPSKRCWGQELPKEAAVEPEKAIAVTVDATQVMQWKQTIYKGLNTLTRDPFSAVCDLFLIHAFGMQSIPTSDKPATIPAEGKARMDKIANSINASLGFAIVSQYTPPEENRAAIEAAISAATETIKDDKQREAFLQKAQLLRGQ